MAKINGDNGQNTLEGTENADEMNGFNGDDLFFGSKGADIINGGQGTDSVSYLGYFDNRILHNFPSYGTFFIGGAVDVDLQRTGVQHGSFAEGDLLSSIENVRGSRSDDVIKGNSFDNVLIGDFGNDVLMGRDGDDVLIGDRSDVFGAIITEDDEFPDSGNDILDGGNGDDILLGDGGNDTLKGGADDDELFGESGNDTLIGGTGVNFLNGGSGIDTIDYSTATGPLQIFFTDFFDGFVNGFGATNIFDRFENVERILASSFDDDITGSATGETLNGSGGNDRISGLGGTDFIDGGTGDDLLDGGAGGDQLIGGAGVDTAIYTATSVGVNVNLGVLSAVNTPGGVVFVQQVAGTGTGGNAQGDTLFLVENLTGSNFADQLTGNLAANTLDGGNGNDVLNGGDGSDLLIGGGGDDDLNGDAGNDIIIGGEQTDIDRLTGGSGFDTFLYLSRDDSTAVLGATGDAIQDFNVNEDLIDLQALGINPANLVIENFTIGADNLSRVTEDVNGNGTVDIGEFSILALIDGAGFVTLQDILV